MTGKEPKHQHGALGVISQLGQYSNANGVVKIATANTTPRKLIWALFVLIGLIVATVQLSQLVSKYLSFERVDVSAVNENTYIEFPAVTVCNIKPVSISTLRNVQATNSDVLDWFMFLNRANFLDHESRMRSYQSLYENVPDTADLISHDFEQTVLHCRFNQKECGHANFTLFFDSKNFYNCFTFETKTNDPIRKQLLIESTGPKHGLSLVMSLNADAHIPGSYGTYQTSNPMAHRSGVRVHIHPPNTRPSPADHGIDISPGFSSSVGLKARLYSRLQQPYGNCTKEQLETDVRVYRYTSFDCLQLCKQKMLVQKCGCKTSTLPMYKHKNNTTIPFCGSINNWKDLPDVDAQNNHVKIASLSCEVKLLEALANDKRLEKACGCVQPCQHTTYDKSISMAYWPDNFDQMSAVGSYYKDREMGGAIKKAYEQLRKLVDKYEKLQSNGKFVEEYDKDDLIDISRATTSIHQNLLNLDIYFEDINVVEFTQSPAYGLANLLADIGGTLVFLMGISVLTIAELVELAIGLVVLMFKTKTRNSTQDGKKEDDSECQKMVDQTSI